MQESLNYKRSKMTGRIASNTELKLLSNRFGNPTTITVLSSVISTYPIIGQSFELESDLDSSNFGVEMEFMTPTQLVEEAFDYYPGISATKSGYVPVGLCLVGSGDPYFVKVIDGTLWIYRIPHTAVNKDDSLDETEVELVGDFKLLIDSI